MLTRKETFQGPLEKCNNIHVPPMIRSQFKIELSSDEEKIFLKNRKEKI